MACDFATLSTLDSTDPEQTAALMRECLNVVFDPMLWVWLVLFTLLCGVVGGLIGRRRKTVLRDVMLGLVLGPIGWIVSLCVPAPTAACPACAARVRAADRFCPRCGKALSTAAK